MAQAASRLATYADLEAVPPHLVAEIVDGVLETHPRPRPRQASVSLKLGGELDFPLGRGRGGPGDWVCEILSPSTRRLDLGPKRRIYGEAGVPFLWFLDPDERTLEAFALTGGRWLLLGTAIGGEDVSLPPFDAITFPLDDLFPFADPAASAPPET
jgi:hypothetical protein